MVYMFVFVLALYVIAILCFFDCVRINDDDNGDDDDDDDMCSQNLTGTYLVRPCLEVNPQDKA